MVILLFGKLADLAGFDRCTLPATLHTQTGWAARAWLTQTIPALASEIHHPSVKLALDHEFVPWHTSLVGHQTIAILPPFSGG